MKAIVCDDAQLISRYQAGDERALSILIERHQSQLFNFIYAKVRDRDVADDLFQDTFVKVIRILKTNQYKEDGKFIQWITRIARNIIMDYFRAQSKVRMVREREEFPLCKLIRTVQPSDETELNRSQIEKDLHKLLKQLPEEQREMVEMRLFYGMSFNEIVEEKDLVLNTALGRMRYAIINLRKLIEKNKVNLME
ncbi:MAG: RNA polymerase subunit sigma-24 [Flavobacterium sp. BFFFF2]|nr:MAG: RNA polymerase subunit sigma-24 [Flavobacterium sp. BFFFF2]